MKKIKKKRMEGKVSFLTGELFDLKYFSKNFSAADYIYTQIRPSFALLDSLPPSALMVISFGQNSVLFNN